MSGSQPSHPGDGAMASSQPSTPAFPPQLPTDWTAPPCFTAMRPPLERGSTSPSRARRPRERLHHQWTEDDMSVLVDAIVDSLGQDAWPYGKGDWEAVRQRWLHLRGYVADDAPNAEALRAFVSSDRGKRFGRFEALKRRAQHRSQLDEGTSSSAPEHKGADPKAAGSSAPGTSNPASLPFSPDWTQLEDDTAIRLFLRPMAKQSHSLVEASEWTAQQWINYVNTGVCRERDGLRLTSRIMFIASDQGHRHHAAARSIVNHFGFDTPSVAQHQDSTASAAVPPFSSSSSISAALLSSSTTSTKSNMPSVPGPSSSVSAPSVEAGQTTQLVPAARIDTSIPERLVQADVGTRALHGASWITPPDGSIVDTSTMAQTSVDPSTPRRSYRDSAQRTPRGKTAERQMETEVLQRVAALESELQSLKKSFAQAWDDMAAEGLRVSSAIAGLCKEARDAVKRDLQAGELSAKLEERVRGLEMKEREGTLDKEYRTNTSRKRDYNSTREHLAHTYDKDRGCRTYAGPELCRSYEASYDRPRWRRRPPSPAYEEPDVYERGGIYERKEQEVKTRNDTKDCPQVWSADGYMRQASPLPRINSSGGATARSSRDLTAYMGKEDGMRYDHQAGAGGHRSKRLRDEEVKERRSERAATAAYRPRGEPSMRRRSDEEAWESQWFRRDRR